MSEAASLPQLTFADSEVGPANDLLHYVRRDCAHFPSQQLPLLPRQLFHWEGKKIRTEGKQTQYLNLLQLHPGKLSMLCCTGTRPAEPGV